MIMYFMNNKKNYRLLFSATKLLGDYTGNKKKMPKRFFGQNLPKWVFPVLKKKMNITTAFCIFELI